MTIFAILMPAPQPRLVDTIRTAFTTDHFMISETQWLISATGTVVELCAKLGIYDAANPGSPPTGIAVVFSVSTYFGRAQQPLWDWIKTKLEKPPNV